MTSKKRIFTTYGSDPIKNVKTPIRRFDTSEQEYDEQDVEIPENELCSIVTNEETYRLLYHIKVLLFVLVILKVICIIKK